MLVFPGSSRLHIPSAASPDGKYLLSGGPAGIEAIPLTGDHTPIPLVTQGSPFGVRFSPDGRWIAYSSSDGRRIEVFIRAFTPDGKSPGVARQISTAGGFDPHWRGDGKEIFFLGLDSKIRVVEVTFHGDEIQFGAERPVFPGVSSALGFDITRDGKRIVMAVPTGKSNREVLSIVQNWTASLQ
jgi:hypothetical protein